MSWKKEGSSRQGGGRVKECGEGEREGGAEGEEEVDEKERRKCRRRRKEVIRRGQHS